MSPSPTRKSLVASTRDGLAYSVMMGAGEANLVVFGLAIGLSEVLGGLLGALPLLGGALLQLISPSMARRLGSHKKWLLLCAFTQALCFLPLAAAALLARIDTFLLFAVCTLYWACNYGAGSVWHTFINPIVPPRVRANYFARRNLIINIALVAASFAAGLALRTGNGTDSPLLPFALLFFVACIARLVSTYFLARQPELVALPADHRNLSVSEFVTRFRRAPAGRLLAYMLAVQVGIQIFTPFLSPYLLEQLHLKDDYAIYGGLVSALLLAKVLALPVLGRIAHAHGARTLLWFGGLATIPVPFLWIIATNPWYLFGVQLFSGAALAAYELATFLLLLETVRDDERTSIMSRYQFCNCAALVAGSLIGAVLLQRLGTDPRAYTIVFLIATGARLATLPLLARVQRDTGAHAHPRPDANASLALHAQPGAPDDPLLPAAVPGRRARPRTLRRR